MEDLLITIITFIFVIGILVFIHEGGHFSVAKLFKVTIETFSLGFGPRLFGFKKNGTDYRVSAIPLGGYVKMLGENPDEIEEAKDEEGSLISKPAWQRFLIFVAGPGANIILAVLIPAVLYMFTYPTLAFLSEPARVGYVENGSPAQEAGIKKEDLIVKFHELEHPSWKQLEEATALRPGQRVPVTVERDGQRLDLTVELGTENHTAGAIGISGLLPKVPVRIGTVELGSPADKAGLHTGDVIAQVNGSPIGNMQELVDIIRPNVGTPLDFSVLRDGQTINMTITPFMDEARGYGRIGFSDDPPVIISRLGPLQALVAAFEYNLNYIGVMGEAMGGVVRGERSVRDTFSGPVGIAAVSGQAAQQGVQSLLMLMAILSLSLGIFNLLPIPILDGGQVMMLFLEKGFHFFGGELSVALREKIQTVGFTLIVLLMGYIIYADIARLIQ